MKDAGCDADQIADVCRLCEAGRIQEAVRALRRHRCGLMEHLHESQNRVDCLDYLVCQMEKELKVKENESFMKGWHELYETGTHKRMG